MRRASLFVVRFRALTAPEAVHLTRKVAVRLVDDWPRRSVAVTRKRCRPARNRRRDTSLAEVVLPITLPSTRTVNVWRPQFSEPTPHLINGRRGRGRLELS